MHSKSTSHWIIYSFIYFILNYFFFYSDIYLYFKGFWCIDVFGIYFTIAQLVQKVSLTFLVLVTFLNPSSISKLVEQLCKQNEQSFLTKSAWIARQADAFPEGHLTIMFCAQVWSPDGPEYLLIEIKKFKNMFNG